MSKTKITSIDIRNGYLLVSVEIENLEGQSEIWFDELTIEQEDTIEQDDNAFNLASKFLLDQNFRNNITITGVSQPNYPDTLQETT